MLLITALLLAASAAPEKKAETCAAKPFSMAMPALAQPKVEAKKPEPKKPAPVQQAQRKPASKPKPEDCLTAKPQRG